MEKQKKSLRSKVLVLLSLVLFCPIIIITTVIVSISYRSLHKSIFYQQVEIANRVADRISNYIDTNMKLSENIIETCKQQSKSRRISLFKNIMKTNSNIIEIILLSTDGQELIKVVSQGKKQVTSTNLINRKNRDEFKKTLQYRRHISPVFFSYQRVPYLFVSSLKHNIILMVKISLKNMWNIISDIKIGQKGYVFVVDNKGILIAHPESARVIAHTDFSNLAIVKDFLHKKRIDTWRIYRDESRTKVVSVYSEIPKLNWAVVTQIPHSEVCVPINKMITQTVFLSGIFSIVFFILGYRFVNNLLNPLEQLRQAATHISKGRFDIKTDIKSNDEIEDLALTFNSMIESLKQLEELRQDLISMIVHDMKSPLSGITGGLDYLTKCEPGTTEYDQVVSIIKNSAESLLTLIQNLVDISRMEEGKLQLKPASVNINELFKNVIDQFEVLVKSEEKEFFVEFDEKLPLLKIDKGLIVRVMNNLLTNALHHTTMGGKIWLKVNKVDTRKIQVSVSDNGVGIPQEYKDKIFEKFVQVERKRARLRTGTGLGLTFCKMAIELHNGKIWVESEPGEGSAFIFII